MAFQAISELAISLPFSIDAFGQVAGTSDQSKIWADRVRAVLGTAVNERVYRPDFGCAAAMGIYENEEFILGTIERDIQEAFDAYLPLLSLEQVNVGIDEYTRIITAEVEYSTPGGANYISKVGIATIQGTNPIVEEMKWQAQ